MREKLASLDKLEHQEQLAGRLECVVHLSEKCAINHTFEDFAFGLGVLDCLRLGRDLSFV